MKIGYEYHKIAFSIGEKSDMGRWVGQKRALKIGYPLWMAPNDYSLNKIIVAM